MHKPALVVETKFQRDLSIDFLKGMLVLSMVLYHTLNYTMNSSQLFRFLRFISPGFVFISGFLIVNVLSRKYSAQPLFLYSKLFFRGCRLFAVFSILNITINLMGGSNYGARELNILNFFRNFSSIYFEGNCQLAAFEILLPIGYLFICAPLFLVLNKISSYLMNSVIMLFIGYCAFDFLQIAMPYNLVSYTFGLAGMAAGQFPLSNIKTFSHKWKLILVINYLLYAVCSAFFMQPFIITLWGTISTLLFFMIIGTSISYSSIVVKATILAGNHSLFGYIIQIFFLQVFYRIFMQTGFQIPPFWISLLATLASTIMAVIIIEQSIRNNSFLKKCNSLIFR